MTQPTVDLEAVALGAARECIRQRVGLAQLAALIQAHNFAWLWSGDGLPTLTVLRKTAGIVDPDLGRIRQSPVTFADGGQASHHTTILPTLERMWTLLDADTDPAEFTKAFLDVHPFRDGNGRTAWLLYNWLRGTLHKPETLPDFYGPSSPLRVSEPAS